MVKNSRTFINWMLSQVSASAAFFGLAVATLLLGIICHLVLGEIERGIAIFVKRYDEPTFQVFASSVGQLRWIISGAFACVATFIFLFGKAVNRHILNQSYALRLQIQFLSEGNYFSKRKMRKYDELHEVMNDLHTLSDKLSKNGK